MEEHADLGDHVDNEEYLNMEEYSESELEQYNDKDPVETLERTFMYTDGDISHPIPVSLLYHS